MRRWNSPSHLENESLYRLLGVFEHHLHLVKRAPCRVRHREPRGDRQARFDELERTDLVGEIDMTPADCGASTDKGSTAETPRYEPRLLELIERAAHGTARGLKGRCQLPLRR